MQDAIPSPPTTFADGFYMEGNIIVDTTELVRNYDPAQTTVTFNNNIVSAPWSGPGTNNLLNDPLLKHIPELSETVFTNWQQAQILRDWFSLQPGSPARGTGPNGRDMGGVIPLGASISGEPLGTNNQTSSTLQVGPLRTGFGIPVTGWPNGSGFTHYKYRLDNGAWSAEIPTTTPISLNGLANGSHHVDVTGKHDSNSYQDDPELGPDAVVTSSRTWVVDTGYVPTSTPKVRLNEILAQNTHSVTNSGATPDLIELYNYGNTAVNLVGMGLSDSAGTPYKYTFPSGTPVLGAGQYLVLYADSTNTPGIHLGFSLKASGDDVYLRNTAASGGALIDSIVFGVQAADISIGRAADGSWVACKPTFGGQNIAVGTADPHSLKINEWLTDSLFLANNDFVEIFNPSAQPIALGGSYLSDAAGAPDKNPIAPLSFIAPTGYVAFVADGDAGQGADHLNFKLSPDVGIIILSAPDLSIIDEIAYGPQQTDVSQGRSPSGSDTLVNFGQPTAGGPNPVLNGGTISVTNVTSTVVPLLDMNSFWRYDNSGTDRGTAWYPSGFDDSSWLSGQGLFGFETVPSEYPYPFRTSIPAPDQAEGT